MHYKLMLFAAMLTIGIAACGPTKEEIIQAEVKRAVSEYEMNELKLCRENLLERAGHMVDSMLLAEAQAAIRDSLFLSKPGRPALPPEIPPVDSTPVAPLFPTEGGK